MLLGNSMKINKKPILFIFFVFLQLISWPVFSNDMGATIVEGVLQAKQAILMKSSLSDIEYIVERGKNNGIKNYKILHYDSNKIGWAVVDNSRRDVFSVVFFLYGNVVKEARYFGPIMQKYNDAIEIHKWHTTAFEQRYRSVGYNEYDIDDNCKALLELSKNAKNEGETVISISCY